MRAVLRLTFAGLLLSLGCGRPAAPLDRLPEEEGRSAEATVMAPQRVVQWAGEPAVVAEEEPPIELTSAQRELLERRPYVSLVPSGWDGVTRIPLVLALHGYSSSGKELDEWYGLSELAEARTFILATPDGSRDLGFQRFWNATDGCCNLYHLPVDDVGYLTAIIDDLRSRYRVDAKRVFVMGHSNGSFMSHRLACERSDRIAAIAAFAGNVWQDASKCQPSRPVSVLQIHGTSDAVINFAGVGLFPSAEQSVATWGAKNGCSAGRTSSGSDLDLDTARAGPETVREQHGGCASGGAAELWKIEGGVHHPAFTPAWAPALYDWLLAHARP